jgi:hypothetical protein
VWSRALASSPFVPCVVRAPPRLSHGAMATAPVVAPAAVGVGVGKSVGASDDTVTSLRAILSVPVWAGPVPSASTSLLSFAQAMFVRFVHRLGDISVVSSAAALSTQAHKRTWTTMKAASEPHTPIVETRADAECDWPLLSRQPVDVVLSTTESDAHSRVRAFVLRDTVVDGRRITLTCALATTGTAGVSAPPSHLPSAGCRVALSESGDATDSPLLMAELSLEPLLPTQGAFRYVCVCCLRVLPVCRCTPTSLFCISTNYVATGAATFVPATESPLLCLHVHFRQCRLSNGRPAVLGALGPAIHRACLSRLHRVIREMALDLVPSPLPHRVGPATLPLYLSVGQWTRVMVRDHFPAVLGHLKRALERLKQLMRSRAPDDKGWRRDDKVEREQMRLVWTLYSVLRQQCFFPM